MLKIMNSFRFLSLAFLKLAGYVVYPSKLDWIREEPLNWDDVSLVLVLNHTSLFEFILGVTLPFRFLKELSKRLIIPVASSTMKDPINRFLFSNLAPKTIEISRKRDDSWKYFLNKVQSNDICIFMPEGRMKRLDGLDKDGNPMTVKFGVYELMKQFPKKKMLLVYSAGLHHILAPGQRIPRIFRRVEARAEVVDIDQYLSLFENESEPWKKVAKDLEMRRDFNLQT